MRIRAFLGCLLVLGLAGWPAVARADEPKDEAKKEAKKEEPKKDDQPAPLADQIKAVMQEYQTAQIEFRKAYQQAKTDEERQKLFQEKYPRPDAYTPRLLKLVEQEPKNPAALDALVFVVSNSPYGPDAGKAIDLLIEHYVTSDKLARVCQSLSYSPSPGAEKLLRKIAADSPHHDIKGQATLFLAQSLQRQSKDPKEIEALLETVESQFADVKLGRGTLADMAKGDLFEIRFLAVGKTVPEIEGQDIDNAAFKLSDYRGKVVVLDFWGNW
jgi:hypothetical protein